MRLAAIDAAYPYRKPLMMQGKRRSETKNETALITGLGRRDDVSGNNRHRFGDLGKLSQSGSEVFDDGDRGSGPHGRSDVLLSLQQFNDVRMLNV